MFTTDMLYVFKIWRFVVTHGFMTEGLRLVGIGGWNWKDWIMGHGHLKVVAGHISHTSMEVEQCNTHHFGSGGYSESEQVSVVAKILTNYQVTSVISS